VAHLPLSPQGDREPAPPLWIAPPETEAGALLRSKYTFRRAAAVPTVGPTANAYNDGTNHLSKAAIDAAALRRRAEWVASLLPPAFLTRVADGKLSGSSEQVAPADRFETLVGTLADAGGRDGKPLAQHRLVLASLIDFGAAASPSVDVCTEAIGPAFVGKFLESEFQRARAEGSVHLASTALASLRFLAAHCGLLAPDLHSAQVTQKARPATAQEGSETPAPTPAGVVPAWLVHRLGLLAQGGDTFLSELVAQGARPANWCIVVHYARAFSIAILCGLRMIELESAYLVEEADPRVISIKYPPKGDVKLPHAHTWAYAVDTCGPLRWWPEFRAHFKGGQTLCPGFASGDGTGKRVNRSDVLQATHWHGSAHIPVGVPGKAWKAITTSPGMLTEEQWKSEFNLTPHCIHGTTNDVCFYLGEPAGLDPATEGDLHGNWSLPTREGQGGPDARGPSQKKTCRRYATGTHRNGSREQVLLARWKLWHAIQVGARTHGYANLTPEGRWAEVRAAILDLEPGSVKANPKGPPAP
jgi:hypothetical protein